MKIYSFPSISTPEANTLILGTMPGQRSIAMNQYYGHGGNAFWKIMFEVFEEKFTREYEIRRQLLIKNGIALWDVLKACEREGSADHAIEKEEVNDFDQFFQTHSQIKLLAFNGIKAENYFMRSVHKRPGVPMIIMPSTSSANGWMRYEQKLNAWKQIKNASNEHRSQ